MSLPPDLPNVLLHMWLGAMPLVAGALALAAIHIWPRARAALAQRRAKRWRAQMRSKLSRAYFATATVVAIRRAAPEAAGVRASLLLAVQAPDGEYPAAAEWLVPQETMAHLQAQEPLNVVVMAGLPRRILLNEGFHELGSGARRGQAVQKSEGQRVTG